MGRLFSKFFIGGIAGLLAWLICEPSAPRTIQAYSSSNWEMTFVAVMGAFIGMAVGGLDGFTRGGKRHTMMGVVLGAIFGAVGITFGHGIGSSVVVAIFHHQIFSENYNMLGQIPARFLVFAIIGACLGAAIGASSLTLKRVVQGAIGGAIGGGIAGISFDIIGSVFGQLILQTRGQSSGEVGGPGRAALAVLMGAAIGLFIGLVERYSRSAWLRLSLGRNEGKEWSIDSAQTFIGRSEGAQVPLFGDAQVAPIHCSIVKQGPNYILTDGGSPIGTMVNGQIVHGGSVGLLHGSAIQVGSFTLQFLLKNQPAPAAVAEAYRGQAYPMGGMPGYPAQPGGMQPGPMPHAPMQPGPMQPGPMQPQPGPYGQPMPGPSMPTQMYAPAQPSQPTMAYGAGAMGGFVLVGVDGPLIGQRFPVQGALELGREGQGVRMNNDVNASRRHATVSPAVGGLMVQDLGSTNGTFVNGQRVSQANAVPGDMIKVGSTVFRVETA